MSRLARSSALQLTLRLSILALLAMGAGFSLGLAVRGALASSYDLQWGASSLLRAGVDPWRAAADGALPHFGPPTYMHALYIVLLPLSHLTFAHAALVWCCINVLLSIGSVALLADLCGLSRFAALCLLLLLWMSTPFRTGLEAGGIDGLEMFLLCVVFRAGNSTLRGVALGFSFCSYIYVPVVVSFLWFRGHIRTLAISVTVPVLACVMTCGLLGKTPREVAAGPFSLSGTAPAGASDVITAIKATLAMWLPALPAHTTFIALAGILLAGALGLYISRREISRAGQFALVAAASLFTLSQSSHAYILLAAPLAYALSERGARIRLVALPTVGLFWFLDRFLNGAATPGLSLTGRWTVELFATCVLGSLVAFLCWSIPRGEGQSTAGTEAVQKPDIASQTSISAA